MYAIFALVVLALLALDLGVFHRRPHAVGHREAAVWSAVWIGLAAVFAGGLAVTRGPTTAVEFATAYAIEKALSVDNVLVFLVLFSALKIPAAQQHRVLFWGVLGALVMRAVFVAVGAVLLERFHFVLYVFGGLLIFTGIKMLKDGEKPPEPERNPLYRLFRAVVPMSRVETWERFFVREDGRVRATPLLLALVAVEATDLVFAVDSIPAVFAVSKDPLIVYSSNVFAILGLRALFFLVAGVVSRLRHLRVGLALLLVLVGGKMLIADTKAPPVVEASPQGATSP